MTDDHNRLAVIRTQDLASKGTHTLHDHQQTLAVRKWLCNAPQELALQLGNRMLRQIAVVVFTQSGIGHDRHSPIDESDLRCRRCSLQIGTEDSGYIFFRIVLSKLLGTLTTLG